MKLMDPDGIVHWQWHRRGRFRHTRFLLCEKDVHMRRGTIPSYCLTACLPSVVASCLWCVARKGP